MRIAGLIVSTIALGACATTTADNTIAAANAEPYYVRHAMQAEVNPAIVAIWDIGNAAMDETGGLDAAQMDASRWSALVEAAEQLEAAGRDMATAQIMRAAHPSNMTTEEYEVSMEQVQALLDADPEGFRRYGAEFADHAARLQAAAIANDAAIEGDIVAGMDAACAACHAQYWYAE